MICQICNKEFNSTNQCVKIIKSEPIDLEISFCSKTCKIIYELLYLENFHRTKSIDKLIDEYGYTEQEVFDALIHLEKIYPSSLSKLNYKDFGKANVIK